MKGLIISPDDRITIKFALGLNKNGSIIGDTSEETLKRTFGEDLRTDTIEEHQALFRRPTFGDLVRITGTISTTDGTGFDFNPLAIRIGRLKGLLKEWSLKDEEDQPIPAIPENVDKLDPVVANIIGVQLDAILGGI